MSSKVAILKPKPSLRPPPGLKAAGKRLWRHIIQTFELEEHDLILVNSLCGTLDRKNQAEKELRAAGTLRFTNRHGEDRQRPQVGTILDCNILLARLRRELSLGEIPDDSRPPPLRFGGPK